MDNRNAGRKPTPRQRPSVRAQQRTRERGEANGNIRTAEDTRGKTTRRSRANADGKSASGIASLLSGVRDNASLGRYPSAATIGAVIALAIAILLALTLVVKACSSRDGAEESQAGSASETEQASEEPKSYSVSFTTTGDLIFWREVADYIDMNGGASAMAGIADELDDADVTISNLESPLSSNESEPVPAKDVYIIGKPEAIEGMRNSGIDIVSLANNHIMDYTGPALQDTLNALDESGIKHAGAGMTEDEADAVLETTVNGASIAFFSWTDIVPDNFVAFDDQPGVASARLNMEDAVRRVREAKETHDIVIVAMHWGVEYQDAIDDYQQRTPAHQLVDAGADVVLGNHPHVPQGIEFYKDSMIAYAHGNCVFRQSFDYGNTHDSYVLHFDITQDGIRNVTAVPLYLSDDYGIPSIAQGEQAQAILDRLVRVSDGMNTAFEIEGDIAHVAPLDSDD